MRWPLSETAVVYGVGAAVLLVVGVVLGRPDVAVLGVPLAAWVLWGWIRRPTGLFSASVTRGQQQSERAGEVAARLEIIAPEGVDTLHVRVQAPGHRNTHALVLPQPSRSIRLSIQTVRTGRFPMFPAAFLPRGVNGVTFGEPGLADPAVVTLVPRIRPLRELPLPFRLQGLTGAHDSRRAGDGGDLRDVNVFTPGDRLRRIDWRVTARRAGQGTMAAGAPGARTPGVASAPVRLTELYVRRTFATADATVMLVLDSRDEVGPDVTAWAERLPARHDEATSLDIAREAAASLARHYLDQGDRVGLVDLGRSRAPVAPAGGRRHLHRLTQRIVLAQPEGDPFGRVRPPQVPSGALIVLLSTFLDDEAAQVARLWRHSGHRVVAVDVLPAPVADYLRPSQRVVFEILRLERVERLRELQRSGVEVIAWEGAPVGPAGNVSTAVALASLARSRVRR